MTVFEILALVAFSTLCSLGFSFACRFEDYEHFDQLEKEHRKKFYPQVQDKMILWWIRYYGADILGPYWSKPIYKCTICMASVQTIIPTIYMTGADFFLYWPMVVLATAGLNGFISFNYNTR